MACNRNFTVRKNSGESYTLNNSWMVLIALKENVLRTHYRLCTLWRVLGDLSFQVASSSRLMAASSIFKDNITNQILCTLNSLFLLSASLTIIMVLSYYPWPIHVFQSKLSILQSASWPTFISKNLTPLCHVIYDTV